MKEELITRDELVNRLNQLLTDAREKHKRIRTSPGKRQNQRVIELFTSILYYLENPDK